MKALVETTGSFLLITPRGEEVRHNRPTVIHNGVWVEGQIAGNQVKLHSLLPLEADDDEFAEWLRACDGDQRMAVESYTTKFSSEATDEAKKPPSKNKPPTPSSSVKIPQK